MEGQGRAELCHRALDTSYNMEKFARHESAVISK